MEVRDLFRGCCCVTRLEKEALRPPGSLWTSATRDRMARTDSSERIDQFASLMPRSCHAAVVSVAVWAQTLAQNGYRRQFTLSFSRGADRRRQILQTWTSFPWVDSQPVSAGMETSSLNTQHGSWSRPAISQSAGLQAKKNRPTDWQGRGLAKATFRT